MGKNGKSTKHRKTRQFLAGGRGRRQGARPLSRTERRETPSAMPRPGGPWPDLRAAAPAADPGRIGKEANQIGKKLFGASHLEAFDLFPMYIYSCEIYLIGLNFYL